MLRNGLNASEKFAPSMSCPFPQMMRDFQLAWVAILFISLLTM
ncbi:hypothetical protein LOK49_LG04G03066 [Camellia lanceoleosa]|uniref:Uncharacterized protein n=1 Tax=Camellia lanceoleosa TaxID=1840588 RepID=A0ACC0HWC6_9ERIC|nr:hypothetical protein LOK49_LG04G03066 [Camellia lanceoleosa]